MLDQVVTLAGSAGVRYQTVRAPFLEGDPAYPGTEIRLESHIQLAVRDPTCIVGVFRPNLES